jgi:thymidine kinase
MNSSAKTLNLLAVAHTYQQQGKSVLLLKPELDTRFGADTIQSKAGIQQKADVLIKNNTNLLTDISVKQRTVDCMLVDEVMYQLFLCLNTLAVTALHMNWHHGRHKATSFL